MNDLLIAVPEGRIVLEKLIVLYPFTKFPELYSIRKFIIALTKASNFSILLLLFQSSLQP